MPDLIFLAHLMLAAPLVAIGGGLVAVVARSPGDCDRRGATLCGSDPRGAALCGAFLCGADHVGASAGGAFLRGANLGGANLCGADLGDAYLGGAKINGEIGLIQAGIP